MPKRQYFSRSGKRDIIKHVYVKGRERIIHIKKTRRVPANRHNRHRQRIKPVIPAPAGRPLPSDNYEFPAYHGTTRLVLIVKDPFWIYAYWEISHSSLEALKRRIIAEQIEKARIVLRMYDVTLVDFNGMNANGYFDIDVGNNIGNWYINLWRDNVSYIGEIGIRADNGHFYSLARSNCVHTPRASYSRRSEQIFMKVEEKRPILFTQLNIPQVHRKVQGYLFPMKKKRVFYITEDEIRQYYANLSMSLRDIISRRLGSLRFAGQRFLLEDESREERLKILSRFPKEYFLKKLSQGASGEFISLGASEHFAGGTGESVQGGDKK